jgi:cyclic pyranopterin phosphate synthase
MSNQGPLVDRFDRVHRNLRISITDRCNIRCFYCMPDENLQFLPRNEVLSFEEIVRFTRVAVGLGIDRVRLTGGEPLVRRGLSELVRQLREISGLRDIALTTNGILLAAHAQSLKDAGLGRVNVSLDGLSDATFQKIARRDGLQAVLEGIKVAQQVGFEKLRLNAVSIRGLTELEVIPLGRFARKHGLELRFIEFMPLDAEQNWQTDQVLSGQQVREILEVEFGPLEPVTRDDPSQPAVDYQFADGAARVGFINSVTEPFCGTCDRLRITAEGKVRNCLFSAEEWDARALLRGGASDDEIAELLRTSIGAKRAGHGSDNLEFLRPNRSMYQIGG